jgi:hypothetical protein
MYGSGSRFLYQKAKILIKTLIFLFWDFFFLHIFEKECKIIFRKGICRKTWLKLSFCWQLVKISGSGSASGSISQKHKSADPDPHPHQNVIDPQHCWKANNSKTAIKK